MKSLRLKMLFLKYLKTRECVVIMTKLPQNFMWGGALAANQFEGGYDKGGKGLSVIDVMTSGAHGKHVRLQNL